MNNELSDLPYFLFSILGIFLILYLYHNLSYVPPKELTIEEKAKLIDIVKFLIIDYGFIFILLLSIAWVIHGIGLVIKKGK